MAPIEFRMLERAWLSTSLQRQRDVHVTAWMTEYHARSKRMDSLQKTLKPYQFPRLARDVEAEREQSEGNLVEFKRLLRLKRAGKLKRVN